MLVVVVVDDIDMGRKFLRSVLEGRNHTEVECEGHTLLVVRVTGERIKLEVHAREDMLELAGIRRQILGDGINLLVLSHLCSEHTSPNRPPGPIHISNLVFNGEETTVPSGDDWWQGPHWDEDECWEYLQDYPIVAYCRAKGREIETIVEFFRACDCGTLDSLAKRIERKRR
jgi:hypothetical protein